MLMLMLKKCVHKFELSSDSGFESTAIKSKRQHLIRWTTDGLGEELKKRNAFIRYFPLISFMIYATVCTAIWKTAAAISQLSTGRSGWRCRCANSCHPISNPTRQRDCLQKTQLYPHILSYSANKMTLWEPLYTC